MSLSFPGAAGRDVLSESSSKEENKINARRHDGGTRLSQLAVEQSKLWRKVSSRPLDFAASSAALTLGKLGLCGVASQ